MMRGPYCGPVARPKFGVADRSVHSEIGPVERVERVGAELQAHAAAIARGPDVKLLDERDVIRRAPAAGGTCCCTATRFRTRTARNREGRGVEVDAGRIVGIERSAALAGADRAAVGIAHARVGEQNAVAESVRAGERDQRAAAVLVRVGDGPVADEGVQQAAAAARKCLPVPNGRS